MTNNADYERLAERLAHKGIDVEQVKDSSQSLMPEGVEQQMSEQEVLDLFAYLCLLKPLGSADNELIQSFEQRASPGYKMDIQHWPGLPDQ